MSASAGPDAPSRPESPQGWEDALRAAGYRITAQRRAVLEALADLSHATGEELLARVRAGTPEVNLSTIYRTLEVLSEVGLVTHAHLHHGAVTYHAVGGPAHIHLVCRGCAQVSSAPVAVAEPLATQVATLTGFTADLSHVVLHGLCARCRESGTPGPRPTLGAP